MIILPGTIPIRIHPIFWLMGLLLGWLISQSLIGMFIWLGIIFISVLVHEFGHALAALAFGQSSHIDLIAFGGLTTRQGGKLKLWQEFVVVASGPLAGLCLCFAAYWLKDVGALKKLVYISYILGGFFSANLFWTITNLLPVLPLDGGSLMRIILQAIFGWRGVKSAFFLSMAFAGALAALCLLQGSLLLGSFFVMFLFENYRNWQHSRTMTEEDKKDHWQQLFKEAEQDLRAGLRQTAFDKFMLVKNQTQAGLLYMSALERLAEIYADQGFYAEAYELLASHQKRWDGPTLFLLEWVCYKMGNYKQAAEIGNRVFELKSDFQTAYLNAQCNARLGNKTAALGWLQCAIREGMPNVKEMLNHQDFDSLRLDESFQKLLS